MKKYLEYIKESNIIELDYNGKQLTELPELPVTLQKLYCNFNKLKELPKLPDSLQRLDCDNNELKELPELPDSLQQIYCYDNPLKCLIPIKFIEQQNDNWLDDYYYPMINSYYGQKAIIDEDESNIKELLKQTNGNIDPQIKQDYKHLFQANNWGLI
jgi:Leucine-rich repeat (LRR) protein